MSTNRPPAGLLANLQYRVEILEGEVKAVQVPIERAFDRLEALKAQQITQEEKIRTMSEDVAELKKDLAEAKREIIESQRTELRRIIYVQGSILLLIVGAVITLILRLF